MRRATPKLGRRVARRPQPRATPSNSSAASMTCCGSILASALSGSAVCERLSVLSGLRKTRLHVPNGPLRWGLVGPNSATTGTLSAAARCIGPVSPPMNRRARRVIAINSAIEHVSRCAVPPLACCTALASGSSPGPWLISTAKPRSCRARATAPSIQPASA